MNLFCFGAAKVMSFTTMNMHDGSVLAVSITSKNSEHSCSASKMRGATTTVVVPLLQRIHGRFSINNHGQSFPAACRHQDFTFVVCKHTIKDATLMWAKSNGQCCSVDVYNIKHRDATRSASVPHI